MTNAADIGLAQVLAGAAKLAITAGLVFLYGYYLRYLIARAAEH